MKCSAKFTTVLSCTTAISVVLAGSAYSADLAVADDIIAPAPSMARPAVSGVNGKLTLQKQSQDNDAFPDHILSFSGVGSISLPLAHSYGLQIDAGAARFDTGIDTVSAGGIGAHLFWRDPDQALLGVYGHYVSASGGPNEFDNVRFGVEGELYMGQFSLEGFAGVDKVDNAAGNTTFFFGEATAAWYATDNFRLEAGVVQKFDNTFGRVGTEYMIPMGANNVALFAQADFGSDQAVRGGIRIYFGETGKSLKARHREDDPKQFLPDFFGTQVNAPPAGPPVIGPCPATIDGCQFD